MSVRIPEFERTISHILRLPEGQHFDVESDRDGAILRMQASGTTVNALRALWPGAIWSKNKNEDCGWWEYKAKVAPGMTVEIYADRVGPKSCRRVESTITETVIVPAREEHAEVRTRKVVRWECPEETT